MSCWASRPRFKGHVERSGLIPTLGQGRRQLPEIHDMMAHRTLLNPHVCITTAVVGLNIVPRRYIKALKPT